MIRNIVTAIAAGMLGVTAFAQAEPPKQIDVPAGDLVAALESISRQANVELVFQPEQLKGLRTKGVSGQLSVQDAVKKLLEGTRLKLSRDESTGAMMIGAATAAVKTTGHVPGVADLHLARSENPEKKQQVEAPSSAEDEDQTSKGVAEILVTGSRLKGASVDRGPAPVTVFDRAKIEELGITTLPDFFRYVTQQPSVRSEENMGGAGGQYADLRGIGIGTGSTAVLIDGRPVAATGSSGTFSSFNLNAMPMAAIERIEVLTTSSSAVYGANAMGGAINIVLKRDLGRPVLDLRYGSAEGGAEERRVSLTTGYSGDRFRGSLLLDYFDREALLGQARDRWRNQDFRRFGGIDRRSPFSNPTTVTGVAAGNLPGLTSRFAAVPVGSSGVGLTAANFTATAGQTNMESLGRFRSIAGEQDRRSGTAFGEFDLTPAMKVFGEFAHEESVTANFSTPMSATLAVPADNEFNPFDVPVTVAYLFTNFGPRKSYSEAESDRLLLGLKGGFGEWDWEVSGTQTKGDGRTGSSDNTPDLVRVNQALAALPPAQTFNVFQDGPGGSPALLASLLAATSITNSHDSDDLYTAAQLRGALRELPAGALEMVVGGTWSKEEILFRTTSFPVPVIGGRTARAAFSEFGVPLVDAKMQIPAVSSLRLTAVVRYDDYSDFGNTVNPQFGLVWSPVPDIALRLSGGTSFSPPNLFSMFAPLQEFPFPVTDPRRNETIPITMLVGGNPNLKPVEGESTTAGFVFTPASVPGLRLVATYWELEVDSRVTVVPAQQLVDFEALFGSRVIRAQPTPQDIAAGRPGRITHVDITRINFGRLKTSGVDWESAYSWNTQWGRLTPSLAATWTAKYSSIELPGTPAIDRVGVASISGTVPKWKMAATLGWARGGIGASATARYTHRYDDAVFFIGPTGRRIPSLTLIDAQAFVALDGVTSGLASWLRGIKLTAGVANLFDKEPPFSELFAESGYDGTQADLIGRTGYLALSKAF